MDLLNSEIFFYLALLAIIIFIGLSIAVIKRYTSQLYTKGDNYFNQGNFQMAQKCFKRGYILSRVSSKRLHINFSISLARIFIMQRKMAEAKKLLLRAKTHSEKLNYSEGLGLIYNYLGIITRREGNFKKALQYYTTSIKHLEKSENKALITRVYNNIAIIYHFSGNLENALKYYKMSYELALKLNLKKNAGLSLCNMAAILKERGNFTEALEILKESLELAKDAKDYIGVNTTLMSIGNIYFVLGDFDIAIKYYEDALAIARKIEDVEGIVYTLVNFSQLVINRSLKDAEKYLLEAKNICEKHDFQTPYVPLGLSTVAMARGDFESAEILLKDALRLSEETKDRISHVNVLFSFIDLLIKSKKFEEALERLEKMKEEFLKKGQGEYLINTHFRMSELFLEWSISDKNIDKARTHIELAIKYAKEIEHVPLMLKSYSALAQLIAYNLNFDDAKKILLEAHERALQKNFKKLAEAIYSQIEAIDAQKKAYALYKKIAKENEDKKKVSTMKELLLKQAKEYISEAITIIKI